MQTIDWLLTATRNLLTGFGFAEFAGPYAYIMSLAGLGIVYLIGVGVIWVFLDYKSNKGPSQGQLLMQGLLTGATLLSPIDALPDVVPGVGQIDDIGLPVMFFIGLIKFLGAIRRLAPVPVRRRSQRRVVEQEEED